MPETAGALERASRLSDGASFGVHLNFCEGRPLSRVPSLTGAGGGFRSKRALALRAFAGQLDPEDVEREVEAQVEVVRGGGVRISHLDSHKHLHQLPGISETVLRVARRFGIERVRCTLEEGHRGSFSRLVRVRLARRLAVRMAAAGLRTPSRVLDVRQVMSTADREARIRLLRRPGMVSEMFCHPGTPEADREKPGSCDRDAESVFLRSAEFAEVVRGAGVRLVTYWEV